MNRQTKRLMARQQAQTEASRPAPNRRAGSQKNLPESRRVTPRGYLKEVGEELSKVNWPSRKVVINYSTVVFVTLTLLIALIFGLNFVFSKAVLFLFG